MFTNDDGGHNLLLHLVDEGDDEVAVVVDITDNVAKKATTSINNGGGHLEIMIFLVNRGERIAELLSIRRDVLRDLFWIRRGSKRGHLSPECTETDHCEARETRSTS
jgi:hypothetical protein